MDKRKYLKDNFFLFKGLTDSELDRIFNFDGMQEEYYSQGDTIQSCNICNKIGIVIKGKAIIRSGLDGVIINKLGKNGVYGLAALFNKPTHLTTVTAATDCTILTMNKNFILNCIKNCNTVSLNYIELLSSKINFLNSKINAYTAKSAENKLYAYLLQLPRDGNNLTLTIDMSTIAKMIGIGRATLYRAFDKLETNGTISKKDKLIIFNEV